MSTFKQDEGRAWAVLVACFMAVGIITDGIEIRHFCFSRFIIYNMQYYSIVDNTVLKFFTRAQTMKPSSSQYSFGLIYTELLRIYNKTNESTSWVSSLQMSFGYLFGKESFIYVCTSFIVEH